MSLLKCRKRSSPWVDLSLMKMGTPRSILWQMVINYGLIGFSGTTGWIWRLKMVKFSIPKMANRSGKWWSKHWGYPVFRSLGFNPGVWIPRNSGVNAGYPESIKMNGFLSDFLLPWFFKFGGYKNPVWCLGASRKSNSNCWNFGTLRRSKRRRWREGHLNSARTFLGAGLNNKKKGPWRVVNNVNAGYKANKQTGYFSHQKPVTQGKKS